MTKRTIVLFGGTFDPIHFGHTKVADFAANRMQAEKIIFIPAKCSPLKGFFPRANDEDRSRMIALSIADNDRFALSDCELKRPAPSFTLDTIRQFKQNYGPETSIHWLLGADSVKDLVHWYKVGELIDECELTTMYRAGYAPPDFEAFEPLWGRERVARLKRNVVQTPLIDISSTEVRRRLAAHEDVGGMLHADVIRYIRENDLYEKTQA